MAVLSISDQDQYNTDLQDRIFPVSMYSRNKTKSEYHILHRSQPQSPQKINSVI